ncbi:MAG: Flp/Fap pilin component [Modestobacter sp.]|nr:Flp/Fap pilin component [Modestobacter sp.]HEV7726078.1 Flp family type IVb pilin [Modestobacter sp.]
MTTFFQALYTLSFTAVDRVKAVKEEKGASAVEYALLVGLIAAAVVVAVGVFSGKLSTLFNAINLNGR